MKYLLCVQHYIAKDILREYYIIHHKVNVNNYFFKSLFEDYHENFTVRKCDRCKEIIVSRSQEIQHNFLVHYQKGGEQALENRQFKITSDGQITKYLTDYETHKETYDFFNSEKLLEDFLEVVDINFITEGNKELDN